MIISALLLLSGCNSCGTDELGCSTNDDCKGIRTCVDGRCETPSETAPSNSDNSHTADNNPFSSTCDSACTGDNLCADGECRPVCNTDEECGPDFVCEGRVEGPGRVCWQGHRCQGEASMGGDERCEMNFSCGDAGPVQLLCTGDGQPGGSKDCECVVDGEVTHSFSWEGSVCNLTHVGDSVRYLCDFDALFF